MNAVLTFYNFFYFNNIKNNSYNDDINDNYNDNYLLTFHLATLPR